MKKHLLHFLFTTIISLGTLGEIIGQYVTIQDTAFINWLNANGFSQCMVGNQLDGSCPAVLDATILNMDGQGLTDLTGLEVFVNTTNLDISHNFIFGASHLPPFLKILRFNYNQLNIVADTSDFVFPNSLEQLEMVKNPNLNGYLPELPNGLTSLVANSNSISSTFDGTFPDSLKYLLISECNFSGTFILPSTLETLHCSNNDIDSLVILSSNLVTLDCSSNRINSLPNLPTTVKSLLCSSNNLSLLPPLPSSLIYLWCHSNNLLSLPALPSTLLQLQCSNNPLTVLPLLPSNLTSLSCEGIQLSTLPQLPYTLKFFSCSNNYLTQIQVTDSLEYLFCYDNILDSIPLLPQTLTYLDCSRNAHINYLPNLPTSLKTLIANNCSLTSVPPFPNSMDLLDIGYNQLTSLLQLPDSISNIFSCIRNNNLTCLPKLGYIHKLYFYNTAITCLPNYPQFIIYSEPPLNSIQLCDQFNNNGCPIFWNLSGRTFYDSIANCNYDYQDIPQKNISVNLYQNSLLIQQANTGSAGNYSFNVNPSGVFYTMLDTANLPFALLCPTNATYTDTLSLIDSIHISNDFVFICKPGFDLTPRSIVAERFRPANFTNVNINAGDLSNFYGANCAAGVSGNIQLIMSGPITYTSTTGLTPSTISGDTLNWNIADFGAVDFFSDFTIVVQTDTFAILSSQVCFSLQVNPIVGDNNISNNTLTQCFTVVGSYDPNIKEVYPSNNIDTNQKSLTYTIHFQNTGSAEAQHIFIEDTLSAAIEKGSLKLLAYSHQPTVQIKDNAVRFSFPNINLPDSNTNEPASHGYIQYSVKLKQNLPIGSSIQNTAFIYFDFNAPIVTNTTNNTITVDSIISNINRSNLVSQSFQLYPNPASTYTILHIPENLIGSKLSIANVTGSEVLSISLKSSITDIETSKFQSGVYFVTVNNGIQRNTKKLVLQQ